MVIVGGMSNTERQRITPIFNFFHTLRPVRMPILTLKIAEHKIFLNGWWFGDL